MGLCGQLWPTGKRPAPEPKGATRRLGGSPESRRGRRSHMGVPTRVDTYVKKRGGLYMNRLRVFRGEGHV